MLNEQILELVPNCNWAKINTSVGKVAIQITDNGLGYRLPDTLPFIFISNAKINNVINGNNLGANHVASNIELEIILLIYKKNESKYSVSADETALINQMIQRSYAQ
jgi:hypothetical protein